jgi:hypothetical protein
MGRTSWNLLGQSDRLLNNVVAFFNRALNRGIGIATTLASVGVIHSLRGDRDSRFFTDIKGLLKELYKTQLDRHVSVSALLPASSVAKNG